MEIEWTFLSGKDTNFTAKRASNRLSQLIKIMLKLASDPGQGSSMAEQRLHKTTVAGSTPAPGTMPTPIETAYLTVSEKCQKNHLPTPVSLKEIITLTQKAATVPHEVVIFISRVLEEADRLSKP
jgi:hypothetical protein